MVLQLGQVILALVLEKYSYTQTVGILLLIATQIGFYNLGKMERIKVGLQMMVNFIMDLVILPTSTGDKGMMVLALALMLILVTGSI